jgi:hypothetical protein
MLVFRCECEQVLGVDNDANKGKLGECPSCGRIIRVPVGPIDAGGKLRFHGTPSRAATAGPLRELADLAPPVPGKNGQSYTNGAEPKPAAVPAAPVAELIPIPSPAVAPVAPVADAALEPVTLAPLTSDEVRETEAAETADVLPATAPETKDPSNSGKAKFTRKGPPMRPGRPQRPGTSKSAPADESIPAGNDPAAAVETLNAKGMGTLASAAAARRKRADAGSDANGAKKSPGVLYLIIGAVVLVAVLVGLLYKAGVFGEAAPPNTPAPAQAKASASPASTPPVPNATAPSTTAATTASTTPETAPATTPALDAPKPPEGEKTEKKDAAPAGEKPTETKEK